MKEMLYRNREWLHQKYVLEGMSMRKMGEMC